MFQSAKIRDLGNQLKLLEMSYELMSQRYYALQRVQWKLLDHLGLRVEESPATTKLVRNIFSGPAQ